MLAAVPRFGFLFLFIFVHGSLSSSVSVVENSDDSTIGEHNCEPFCELGETRLVYAMRDMFIV